MDNKDSLKQVLEIASSVPIKEVATPANIIYNIANYSGVFDKEGFDKLSDKELFFDFLFDGKVVNEEKARKSNCKCTEVNMFGNPNKKRLECWKPGILGVLTEEQIKEYCPAEKRIMEETKETRKISEFIEASDKCEYGKEYKNAVIETIDQRITCFLDELHKHGLDITEI